MLPNLVNIYCRTEPEPEPEPEPELELVNKASRGGAAVTGERQVDLATSSPGGRAARQLAENLA
ncbi:hypothetical protein ACGFYE_04805 [Streptomyces zaomyceticus]|uniref:hypothetical protein n=1 Tax=Streptomyces zaomyceticus TaxID=68286 RepID=UPI0037194C6A